MGDGDPERGCATFTDRDVWGDVSARLFARQFIADGADDLDGVCGGRRNRSDRKHHALYRKGHDAGTGRVSGSPRNWIHRRFDEHFADGGVHSNFADGRNRGEAFPRVCGDAERGGGNLDGGVADDHADDVREIPEGGDGTQTQFSLPHERARLSVAARYVRHGASLGFAPSAGDAAGDLRDDWAGNIPLHRDSEGIFPATGYRALERRNSGGAGYFLQCHAEETDAIYSDREG